ncbi:hypothetical protein [Leyella stercorea]|uniref:hypothetical protein n=1 Tax=Leyella stercorea TaxID=363265 RepID=UPI00242ADF1C|nr:hypothetical protein [Leyella stercorea]
MSVISIRIGRRRHPHRSAQTYASVDADIRNGRRRHPQRPTRMLFSPPHHHNTSTSQHQISTPQHLTTSPSINNNGKVDIPSTLPLSLK